MAEKIVNWTDLKLVMVPIGSNKTTNNNNSMKGQEVQGSGTDNASAEVKEPNMTCIGRKRKKESQEDKKLTSAISLDLTIVRNERQQKDYEELQTGWLFVAMHGRL